MRGNNFIPGIALGVCLCVMSCQSPDKDTAGAAENHNADSDEFTLTPNPDAFVEIYERGLLDYVGTVEPITTTTNEEGVTRYEFSTEDGVKCLRGAPYSMVTRSGSVARLHIYLQGGGACSSKVCAATAKAGKFPNLRGINNAELPANPVKDWDMAYLPYCDGSLFTGDIDIDDDEDGEPDRFHRGLRILSASLDVVKRAFPDPEIILLSGSSAGGYGVIMATALVRHHYPGVIINAIGDGGLGIGHPSNEAYLYDMMQEWNVTRFIPDSCENCLDDGHLDRMMGWALDRDPGLRLAGISSFQDVVIGNLFLGITGEEYEAAVLQFTSSLEEQHPYQYHSFLFNGIEHTTLYSDSTDPYYDGAFGLFDVTNIEGVTVADWVSCMVDLRCDWQSLSE